MGLVAAEFLKLRRSRVGVFAVLLPLLATVAGAVNYWVNRDALNGGWDSLASQVTLFYGLMFFNLGVALMAASVWRPEHRDASWNIVLTSGHRPWAVVLAKSVVLVAPVAVAQVVLLALTWALGLTMGMPGWPGAAFALSCALAVVIAVPLILAQSLLSMLMKSFAAPVAVCLLLSGIGFGSIAASTGVVGALSYALPQGLASRALFLGSTAVTATGGLSPQSVAPLLAACAVLSTLLVCATVLIAPRRTIEAHT